MTSIKKIYLRLVSREDTWVFTWRNDMVYGELLIYIYFFHLPITFGITVNIMRKRISIQRIKIKNFGGCLILYIFDDFYIDLNSYVNLMRNFVCKLERPLVMDYLFDCWIFQFNGFPREKSIKTKSNNALM